MLKSLLNQLFRPRRLRERSQLARRPRPEGAPDALLQHAIREFHANQLANAYAIAEQLVHHDPRNHLAWNLLGATALAMEKNQAATKHFEEAVALCPADASYLSNCGEAFRRAGKFDDAIKYCRAAIEADPRHAPAYHNLALALRELGAIEEAYVAFQNALTICPDFRAARSAFLFLLCHHPGIDASVVLAEHRRWEEVHARALPPTVVAPVSRTNVHRPLRVGYVSADFRRHALCYFLEPLLAHHDRERIEVFCYHNSGKADEVTDRLRSYVQHWREISAMTDEAVAGLVSQDDIDILIDLSGHTAGGRLLTFARRPARVQASYLGYLNTTGLASMDFRITDHYADPEGVSEAFHTEQLVRMPHSLWCYRPPDDTPEVNSLPASQRERVTFGSLHNLAKLNHDVTELWARLLAQLPNSMLLIGGVPDGAWGQRLLERFAGWGVDASRLRLIGRCNFDDYWRLYHGVDITLDSFPYNGATTTCESLWMGVPVVTLAGRYAAARSGVSLLVNAGLSDLIADSPDRYIEIAVGLARDLKRLSALRASLRGTMQKSPLMDEVNHVRAFEMLLHSMYRQQITARP